MRCLSFLFLLCPFCLIMIAITGCGETPPRPAEPDRVQASPEKIKKWQEMSHDPAVLAKGRESYLSMKANCRNCHGDDGLGAIGFGPSLRDDYWIYGSDIDNIYQSLAYGRNKGQMPGLLPSWKEEDIAILTAFIASWSRDHKDNDHGYRKPSIEIEAPITY